MTLNLRYYHNKIPSLIFIVAIGMVILFVCLAHYSDIQNRIRENPILATNDEIWSEFIEFLERKGKYDLLKRSYLKHRVEEFDNPDKYEILENLVPLFIITPTYPRPLQLPELTRVAQSLKVIF